jgi:hypothetical protein
MQPDRAPAGIKGVRKAHLEKLTMDPGVIAVSIPIVAIVFGIGIGALSIWTEHKRKGQLLEQLHKERLIALEKGLPPPDISPGLVGFLHSRNTPLPKYLWPRAMRNGVMLVLIGVVLYFAIDNVADSEGALFSLVPAAVGIANLLYAAVLRKQEMDEPPKSA